MNKVLFLYNDLNNTKGISDVMRVAERYARQSSLGNFTISTRPFPVINFEDGSYVEIKPISKGIASISQYDEIYIDDSVNSFLDLSNYDKQPIKMYNENSFN